MFRTAILPVKTPIHPYPSLKSVVEPRLPAYPVSAAAATINVDSVERRSPRSTLYQILRIKKNASRTEIKAAYRNLAKLYHPDATSLDSNGRLFIEIHNAYATLSDPEARANYDWSLSIGAAAGGPHSRLRYSTSDGFPGFRSTRRWETDQCW